MEVINQKIERISEWSEFLFDKPVKKLTQQYLTFLDSKGFNKECAVEDRLCESCIESWLSWEVKRKLFNENSPFNNYQEKIDFVTNNPNHFSCSLSYRFDDDSVLNVFPSTKEEARIFTPHLIERYESHWQQLKANGQTQYSNFPITNIKELKEDFYNRYNASPIPSKYHQNEIERIEDILEKTIKSINDSFSNNYNSIVNCEEVLFNHESDKDETLKFYLSSLTRPIALYKVFLDSFGQKKETALDPDVEIANIEITLRELIIKNLGLLTTKDIKQNFNGEIVKSIESSIERERKKDPQGVKRREHLVQYWIELTDLGELKQIILQKNNWKYFEPIFLNKTKLETEFNDLLNLRNPIRHTREVTEIIYSKGKGSILWFKSQLR